MKKDQDYIVKIEKAISEKYGEKAIQHPKAEWNDEKEKEYLLQLKEIHKKELKHCKAAERVEKEGFFISKKLINKRNNRICPICSTYSFDSRDDLYMKKFECCFNCFVKWVEDREERWQNGWRPNQGEKVNGNDL